MRVYFTTNRGCRAVDTAGHPRDGLPATAHAHSHWRRSPLPAVPASLDMPKPFCKRTGNRAVVRSRLMVHRIVWENRCGSNITGFGRSLRDACSWEIVAWQFTVGLLLGESIGAHTSAFPEPTSVRDATPSSTPPRALYCFCRANGQPSTSSSACGAWIRRNRRDEPAVQLEDPDLARGRAAFRQLNLHTISPDSHSASSSRECAIVVEPPLTSGSERLSSGMRDQYRWIGTNSGTQFHNADGRCRLGRRDRRKMPGCNGQEHREDHHTVREVGTSGNGTRFRSFFEVFDVPRDRGAHRNTWCDSGDPNSVMLILMLCFLPCSHLPSRRRCAL